MGSMFARSFFFLLLMSTPLAAEAQTVFMVQLGTYDSQEKAQAHWNDLSKKFPDVFGGLKYTPDQFVKHPDNFVSYRTQAGPIASREEAENICATIGQGGGGDCYVAETAMFSGEDPEVVAAAAPQPTAPAAPAQPVALPPAPVTAAPPPPPAPVAAIPTAPVAPPATAVQPVAPPPAPMRPVNKVTAQQRPAQPAVSLPSGYVPSAYATPEHPVTSPQSFVDPYAVQDSSPPQAYLPQAAAPTVGEAGQGGTVAVQEAIPVPLSEPASNPYLERGNALMNAKPSDNSRLNSYWADISSFRSETAALQYVHVLKSRDNLLPRTLRIRITRPYGNVSEQGQLLSLRMGPFVTTVPVRRICALTRSENMRCRAVKDLGGSVQNTGRYNRLQSSRQSLSRNSDSPYLQYRRNVRGNASPFGTASQSYAAKGGALGESYHVQLGSFLSVQAAEDKWRELNGQHPALKGVTNEIISPNGSSHGRLFRLRTSGFADFVTANSLCNTLKAGGTLCIVVK